MFDIDFLYKADASDKAILGDLEYCGPAEFSHGEWYKIADIHKTSGDGYDVEIHECRMPARSFKLVVKPGPDSIGEMRPGFALSTGTGDAVGALLVAVAKQVARGMIALEATP